MRYYKKLDIEKRVKDEETHTNGERRGTGNTSSAIVVKSTSKNRRRDKIT